MNRVRVGAVGYLNARPLVYGLDHSPRFEVRYDIPSECARLLHEGATDIGLIPSIEYLRGGPYRIVPDLAIASCGPVASVAVFTTKPIADVSSIAMDTSSRTSVALSTVMLRRAFGVTADALPMAPDLEAMLARADAALIIGDTALFLDHQSAIQKIDLGELWTQSTGLPFVYAVWAGWPDAIGPDEVRVLQRARDLGVAESDQVACAYYPDDPVRQAVAKRYLRDNIQYTLGDEELEGLKTFYRYAAEQGLVPNAGSLRFF